MINNDNFTNEKRDMNKSRIAPCCGEVSHNFRRKKVENSVFLYRYNLVCINWKRAFQIRHNTENWDLIHFTIKDEVKLKFME